MSNPTNTDLVPSLNCRSLIQRHEGLKLTAYPDCGAYSVGYGHRGVPPDTVWTLAQANAAFDSDLATFAAQVKNLVDVPLTQGQFDALVDFVFNLGAGRLAGSTLLRLLNKEEYEAAGQQLLRWDIAGGKENDNLEARREADLALWNSYRSDS